MLGFVGVVSVIDMLVSSLSAPGGTSKEAVPAEFATVPPTLASMYSPADWLGSQLSLASAGQTSQTSPPL